MARRKTRKAPPRGAKTAGRGSREMIISKVRTKNAAGINVSGDFYRALDGAVREMIRSAERRAKDNGRRTLRPCDL